ncbi:MAG: DoxX family protein [Myxococcota bacterium]
MANFSLGLMVIFYVFAGAMHFITPASYLAMMPPALPEPLALVYLSGVAEAGLGLALIPPKTRRWAAIGIILLLIAVFPANIYVALHDIPLFGAEKGAGIGNWIRLPIQGLFIAWAYWHAKLSSPAARSR